MMLGLINNYTPFFLFSRDFNDKTVVSSEIFDHTSFCKIFPPEDFDFMQDFVSKTMIFNRFLEDSYKILYFSDFLKKNITVPSGLEETNSFINVLKKISKAMNKNNNGKYEGFFDLDSLQHLQRLIDLDKDLRFQMAIENDLKPKIVKIEYFFQKYVNNFGVDTNQNKNNTFFLIKGFNHTKFMELLPSSNSNLISLTQNNLNIFKENKNQDDEFTEFIKINLPTNPMVFPAKSPLSLNEISNDNNQNANGLIEAILLKEMELCSLHEKKKPRRKTIFSKEESLQPKPFLQDINIEEVLKIKNNNVTKNLQKEPEIPSLCLKKTKSEQPGFKNNENIHSFQIFSNKTRTNIQKENEEITRKVPILNVNNNGDIEQNEENREFSIFSYLISDMMKEDTNKLAIFPSKAKNKDPTLTPLPLKRHLTIDFPEKPVNSIAQNKQKFVASTPNEKKFPEEESSKNIKIPEFLKNQSTEKQANLIKKEEMMSNYSKLPKSHQKIGFLNKNSNENMTVIKEFQAKTPQKSQITPGDILNERENSNLIGFSKKNVKNFRKEDNILNKEQKALKEMTNFTLNSKLEASTYDYNTRLLKKK